MPKSVLRSVAFAILLGSTSVVVSSITTAVHAETADIILHHGKVVTVDKNFSLAEAIALRGNQILVVGTNEDVLKTAGEGTEKIDLAGKMVLPGLIDSHVHANSAAMYEFDHPVPDMQTIQDVLDYIAARTKAVPEGSWIWVSQVFITRLKEQRYPTREELDAAAPKHPVVFRTGPDAALNSLALKESGIDEDFQVVGSGHLERDEKTGRLNGILRGCTRLIKDGPATTKKATEENRMDRLAALARDYNSVGLTTVADRDASSDAIRRYFQLAAAGKLKLRVSCSHSFSASGSQEELRRRVKEIADHALARNRDGQVSIVGTKIYLDGGMLTGSAYMREPWGISKIYSITDPRYRGVRFVEQDQLERAVRAVAASGLQFTAHSVGDGAVHALIEAYENVGGSVRIRQTRPCITHCNFMSREAIDRMAAAGIVADIQPAWLYLDAHTLRRQFGDQRLRYFQPLASLFKAGVIAGGGSDHMQKIGSLRSINPYNPFLGMWVTVARHGKHADSPLHPEEALSREQMIRFYTSNNAYITFRENQVGSLEPGKRADLIVVDTDLLECDADKIKDTQVLATYFDGKRVYEKK